MKAARLRDVNAAAVAAVSAKVRDHRRFLSKASPAATYLTGQAFGHVEPPTRDRGRVTAQCHEIANAAPSSWPT